MSELKKGISKFQLVGKINVNDKTFQINQSGKKNTDYVYSQLNLSVNCGSEEGNILYCSLMGGFNKKTDTNIYAHGWKMVDGKKVADFENQIQIPFSKRTTSIIEEVSDDCFITVGIEKDVNNDIVVKKFIAEYDAIEYLKNVLKDDMVVSIRGDIKLRTYNGNTIMDKNIKNIWISNATENDFRATFDLSVLFKQDSFGDKDEDGFVPMYGYSVDYYNKDIRNVCYPVTLYIDTQKMPQYEAIIKSYLRPTKSEDVFKVGVVGCWAKADNTVEVTNADLSDDLKALVALGLLTEEEALGRAIGNSRKNISKAMFKTLATKKNENGVDILVIDKDGYKVEDLVFVPDEDKETEALNTVSSNSNTTDNNVKSSESQTNSSEISSSLLDDLFN